MFCLLYAYGGGARLLAFYAYVVIIIIIYIYAIATMHTMRTCVVFLLMRILY
jgi:hypothetical protein